MQNNQHKSQPQHKNSERHESHGTSQEFGRRNRRMQRLIVQHVTAFLASFSRLSQAPLASLLTIGVIGIALALPAALYLVLQNAEVVSQGLKQSARISLFLKADASLSDMNQLMSKIKSNPDVDSVEYISPADGLAEFEKQSGFGNVLKELKTNPLPPVIVVYPAKTVNSSIAMHHLLQQFQALPSVDVAQLDMQWIRRLYALIDLAKNAVWGLAALLSIAVLLIIGNTMRLSIANYRNEIQVVKLVGATNAFIRRPFIYTGILYGGFGAICALLFIDVLLLLLSHPVSILSSLYQSDYILNGFGVSPTISVIGGGIMLGLLGAWVAVSRQISRIEPE